MRDLLDVRDFYIKTNRAALDGILNLCQAIIGEPAIEKKIAHGLAIAPLLTIISRTSERLTEIASPQILENGMPRSSGSAAIELADIRRAASELKAELGLFGLFSPDIAVLESIAAHCANAVVPMPANAGALPRWPARDPALRQSPHKPFRFPEDGSIVADPQNYLGFLYYVLVDVEISAMEVCSYMALRHHDMPVEFRLDMARQIWDEARHAAYIFENFTALGGQVSMFAYTNTIIHRFNASSDILDELIVQHVLQEANAVENNISLAKDLAAVGRNAESLSFMVINNDEALHARLGFKWIEYLAKKNGWPADYLFARMLNMCRKVGLPPFGMGSWTDVIRKAIGSPDWLMHKKTYLGMLFLRGKPGANEARHPVSM